MKAALLCILLTGCASLPGVNITDEERKACAAEKTCTVWSVQHLRDLARHFFGEGYKAGVTTGRKSL